MEEEENYDSVRIAEYMGRIIALLALLQHRYESFTHAFSFNIYCDDDTVLHGANVSDRADSNDIRELIININEVILQKNPDGIEFVSELEKILRDLEIDISNDKRK